MKIYLVLFFIIVELAETPSQVPPKADLKNVETAAMSFVADLTKTHNINSLLQKWFIKNFDITAIPDVDSAVWDDSAKKLPPINRRRLFLASWNWMYVVTVINYSTPKMLECYDESPECKAKNTKNLLRVFSIADVLLIQKFSDGDREEKTELDMFAYVPSLENLIRKAQPILRKKNLEQTSEFRDSIKLFEESRFLNYVVETIKIDENIKDQNGLKIIKKGETLYSVETPLLIRIDFVKRGKSFKVFNLGAGDGD